MIATAKQGLKNYKNEVRKYGRWLNGMKKRHPGLTAQNASDMLDGPNHTDCIKWNHKLAGMRLALGITKAEDNAIEIECSIVDI